MPQRFLRPGITTSDAWNSVSFGAQSLFIRILTLVDDFGRYDGRVPILHGHCFALRPDVLQKHTAGFRSELQRVALIDLYVVDGKEFIQVSKWHERARSDSSKYPSPQDCAAERSGTHEKDASLVPRSSPSTIATTSSTIDPRSPRSGPQSMAFAIPENLIGVEGFEKAWEEFGEHRKQIKAPLTPLAAKGILEDLQKRPPDSVSALKMAMRRSWRGFEWSWFDKEGASSNGNGLSTGAKLKAQRSIGLCEEHLRPPTKIYTDDGITDAT